VLLVINKDLAYRINRMDSRQVTLVPGHQPAGPELAALAFMLAVAPLEFDDQIRPSLGARRDPTRIFALLPMALRSSGLPKLTLAEVDRVIEALERGPSDLRMLFDLIFDKVKQWVQETPAELDRLDRTERMARAVFPYLTWAAEEDTPQMDYAAAAVFSAWGRTASAARVLQAVTEDLLWNLKEGSTYNRITAQLVYAIFSNTLFVPNDLLLPALEPTLENWNGDGLFGSEVVQQAAQETLEAFSRRGIGAGLEERSLKEIREKRMLLPSILIESPGLGLVVGPHGGLEEGLLLSRFSIKTSIGSEEPLPVAFLVETPQEAAGLEKLGISPLFIFRVEDRKPLSLETALQAARRLLGWMGATQIIERGIRTPVQGQLWHILQALGLQIDPQLQAGLEEFTKKAAYALQQA